MLIFLKGGSTREKEYGISLLSLELKICSGFKRDGNYLNPITGLGEKR